MTSSADRDDDLKEQWPFPKSGPIATKDIPLSEPSPSVAWLDRPHRDPDVATFLNSGTAITVSDIVHSLDPGKGRDTIWLHHDGSLSRGNVDPIEFSTAEEIDRRIELGLDPQDHPGSTHAGSVKIRRTSTAVVDVQYTDSMSEAQKMTLGRIDHAVREAGGTITVNHIESFGAREARKEYEWAMVAERAAEREKAANTDNRGFGDVISSAAHAPPPHGWLRRQFDSMSRLVNVGGRTSLEAAAERPEAGSDGRVRSPIETTIRGNVFRVTGDRYRPTAKSKERDDGLEI